MRSSMHRQLETARSYGYDTRCRGRSEVCIGFLDAIGLVPRRHGSRCSTSIAHNVAIDKEDHQRSGTQSETEPERGDVTSGPLNQEAGNRDNGARAEVAHERD